MNKPDYRQLIDRETWLFIEQTEAFYPPESAALTIADQRQAYDRMCDAFRQPRPAGVAAEDRAFGGVPCRLYRSAADRGAIVYLHGGGFVVGGLESHDDVCAEICGTTGRSVVSVDYRLAPEHPHPAAYDDALAATRAAKDALGPLSLVGDSAGGALAASVSHALRGERAVLGQVLIYPALGGDVTRGSYRAHAVAPMLTLADVQFYNAARHDGAPPPADPTADALQDRDFSGLPSTVVFAAECDPLCDDGRAYCEHIRAAGGEAECIVEAGLVHGYLRARHRATRASESFSRILAAIERMGPA